MEKIEINKNRILHLLASYRMSVVDLLSILNEGRKKILGEKDIINDLIALPVLKQIDKVFEKGLNYYQDFSEIANSGNASIFFRKDNFATQLNFESIRLVHKFEQQKRLIDGLAVLSEMNLQVSLTRYKLTDNAKSVAQSVRGLFMPAKTPKTSRMLLKEMIAACANNNIFVFEFIETWNKKNKANIDGFYLNPNMIVLKRQKSYKRELFTLAHEIGHCLLGAEEVEPLDLANINVCDLNEVEHWCNDFAFYLITGELANLIDNIKFVSSDDDYYHDLVSEISKSTFISRLAIYTQLLIHGKVRFSIYSNIKADLMDQYNSRVQKEKENNANKEGHAVTPKPIMSPLYLETMQMALYNGVISETQFCEFLNVKSTMIEKYL